MSQGPFGAQCLRCVLNLAVSGADEEQENELLYVAEIFPELKVEGRLARGGFGTVFRAEHRRLRRHVALKFLDSLLSRSREAVELFQREMITVGSLNHPGIVHAHDAGERDDRWYIVMELVDGLDCGALVRKHGHLPVAESCEIIRQAALTLHYAHGRGLVHRDVKPGNLMIVAPWADAAAANLHPVKVLDFGLAGLSATPSFGTVESTEAQEGISLVIGTLEYVAPEQIEHPETVDARADLYGLGATLWRMLTGKPAREGGDQSLFRHMKRLVTEAIPPIATERPDLPKPLARLCDRLLALDPALRPADAAEVAALLKPWCAGAELRRLFTDGPLPEKPFVYPKPAPRPWWIAAAAALLVLTALVLLPSPKVRGPDPTAPPAPARRPVFSPQFLAERNLEPAASPHFLTDDWEVESETTVAYDAQAARMLPDGNLAYISSDTLGLSSLYLRPIGFDTPAHTLRTIASPYCFGVAPDPGCFIWGRREAPKFRQLGRARADGSPLPALSFDPSGDFDPTQREEWQQLRRRNDEGEAERRPVGFAFVLPGQIPANSRLRAGDVLVADEGHRWLAPGTEGAPDVRGPGGLWVCRLDDNEPARRLSDPGRLVAYPLEVTVAKGGVFLLNRRDLSPTRAIDEEDRTRRILRWDTNGFHACTLDQPIHDPSALAADPAGTDLYVGEGALIPSSNPAFQRILRLRRTGDDQYSVEIVAQHFGRLGLNGLAFAPDLRRLVLTDSGNRVILVLKRTGPKA